MADLILTDEASSQSSRPTEYYDIVISTGVTYYIASGNRDLLVGNVVYKATPTARSDVRPQQVQGNDPDPVTLSMPVDHPVVTRWFAMASPPSSVIVTCWRKQERSGLAEKIWTGEVTGVSCEDSEDGQIAKLAIPSRTMERMQRVLPRFVATPTCQHDLYDAGCKIARAAFQVGPVATLLVNGRTVRVDMGAAHGGDWAENGELLHVATGERMTIAKQTDIDPGVTTIADLQMDGPIPELRTGDQVTVFAGCKKGISICLLKFNNKDNYGSFPDMPTRNPMVPGGFGTGSF
jgi:hypothetical protein